jgi:hypothetical protein
MEKPSRVRRSASKRARRCHHPPSLLSTPSILHAIIYLSGYLNLDSSCPGTRTEAVVISLARAVLYVRDAALTPSAPSATWSSTHTNETLGRAASSSSDSPTYLPSPLSLVSEPLRLGRDFANVQETGPARARRLGAASSAATFCVAAAVTENSLGEPPTLPAPSSSSPSFPVSVVVRHPRHCRRLGVARARPGRRPSLPRRHPQRSAAPVLTPR